MFIFFIFIQFSFALMWENDIFGAFYEFINAQKNEPFDVFTYVEQSWAKEEWHLSLVTDIKAGSIVCQRLEIQAHQHRILMLTSLNILVVKNESISYDNKECGKLSLQKLHLRSNSM